MQLDKYILSTREALISYIPTDGPREHLYDLVPKYPLRGGKGFRPGLCMATCGAFGGNPRAAQQSAVALELFHNAFLVHDDIEDGSESRRGEPTLHESEGIPVALNVGDAMNVLSMRPLMENIYVLGPKLTYRVMEEVEHMVRETVEGQAMELGWVRDNICDIGDDDYLRMILKKTCWYTCIHPCRIGALIGTGGEYNPQNLDLFGYYLGASFQIQDDLLNLVGEEEKYGKEIGGDIWEGKRTLMLAHLLRETNSSEYERLKTFLDKPRRARDSNSVEWVYRMMDKYGCIEYGRSCARQLAGAALREYHVRFAPLPSSDEKQAIEDLVMYMVERDL
ncbi:MAG: polyprenyl synthetase family protein [Deltaproteobacteria bacterium]|nr:polyprenyl synthetase family protein [Deltaproteobacteria bacterium]